MTYTLTPKQSRLLRYIDGFIGEHGYSPSFREMQEGIGASSKGKIFERLAALEERGHIRRLPNRARAIELLHPAKPIFIEGERYRYIPPPPTPWEGDGLSFSRLPHVGVG